MKRHPTREPKTLLLKKAATLLLLFSFIVPAPQAFAQKKTSEESASTPIAPAPESDTDSTLSATGKPVKGDLEGGVSMMSSPSNPLLIDHQYQVAADLRNSQVNGTNGAYVHSIPIVIPPGRNGMEPELRLEYSSQGLEELNFAGYGWDVPIPYIKRFNKKGADKLYTDSGFYSSLSGELATTTDPSLYYARSDDGSFIQHEFASSANQWTVKDKNGRIYKFGHASTTRQDNPSDSTKVYKWMLEEVRDTNGNYIKYEYTKDNGYLYPSRITYTGNGSTDGVFTVSFNYELRTDNATSSVAGFEAESRYRLDDITISIGAEWVRKYEFTYVTGDNDRRSLLDSVTESARSIESGTTTTALMPINNFDYQASTPGWATTTSEYLLPEKIMDDNAYTNAGLRFFDANGDGLTDAVRAKVGTTTRFYLNNGTGWTYNSNWTFPEHFTTSLGGDNGVRLADLNGDGLVDVLYGNNGVYRVHLHTGTGWATSTDWGLPQSFVDGGGNETSARVADVNGDGLADFLYSLWYTDIATGTQSVYLNTGSGWSSPTGWVVPSWFGTYRTTVSNRPHGTFIDDVNNDGLADLITKDYDTFAGYDGVFLNNGNGWTKESSWTVPREITLVGDDRGQRLLDVNGDNLPDWIDSIDNDVYINTGFNWVLDNAWVLPVGYLGDGNGYAAQFTDVNGDNMVDIVQRNGSVHNRFINNGKPVDALTHIDESTGSKIDLTYKASARYRDQSSNLLNTDLPFNFQTIEKIASNDGLGNIATTTYEYDDGDFYYAGAFDRTFSGFGLVSKTDSAGNVSKVYYHQGNTTASTTGEFDDARAKIGKPYRTEAHNSSGSLYGAQINKWEHANRVGNADFAYQTRATTLTYDGDADHKDTAETYTYSTTTGSLLEKIQWGEITGSTDGSYTDIGSDKRTTTYEYVASSTAHLILPKQETTTDQSSNKINEAKNYYDTLSHGSINKGNLTKQEAWKTGSNYIDIEKTYNSYGLVTQELDARNSTTTFVYDSYNLYPATTTNALSHAVDRYYDYSSGKVIQMTDANGRVFQTLYEPFDRVKEEKQPDLSSPGTLVTKTTHQYTDTGMPRSILRTDNLSSTTSIVSYAYLNGLGKKVQERTEAEGTNYAVKDFEYDKRRLLKSESLPYFSTGTAFTGTSSPPSASLQIRYIYDPLERILEVGNSVGTTTNAYDQWEVTTTDAKGSVKEFTKDAYGNLVQVVEDNGVPEYTTAYEYDGNNKLKKVTDHAGNIRNFTYDGLGRRLTAQDLHDTGDASFGTWTFEYDDTGNLSSTTDPKSQVVERTYDVLNRILTENYTGQGGTEISYAYDTCSEGKGRICAATTTGAVTSLSYNALGLTAAESRTISGTTYGTTYTYDRVGNITGIVYPDNSEIAYSRNAAGLLESITRKENGGSFTDVVTDFDYAPTGKVSFKNFGNGVTSEYTYDAAKLYRLTRILTTAPAGESLMGGGGGEQTMSQPEEPELFALRGQKLAYAGFYLAVGGFEPNAPLADLIAEPLDEAHITPLGFNFEVIPNLEPVPQLVEPLDLILPIESSVELPAIDIVLDFASSTLDLGTTTPDVATTTADIATTTTEIATTTPNLPWLLRLPADAKELKLKASKEKLLGHKEFSNGILKYAYRTDINVDSLPISEETLVQATKANLSILGEAREQRTKHSRTYATDKVGTYVTEIVEGDPQYYKDEKDDWWVADYGVTTKESYDLQLKPEDKGLIRRMLDEIGKAAVKVAKTIGLLPERALAASSTFYPDANPESTTVDGNVYKDNSTSWPDLRSATASNFEDDNTNGNAITDQYGNGNGPTYYGIRRAFLLFNTASIPDTHSVGSSSMSIYNLGVDAAVSADHRLYVVSSTPASNTAIIMADFDQIGSTSFGVSDGTFVTNTYESIPLNAFGLNAISKTGVSKFAIRSYNDFNDRAPTTATRFNISITSAEQTGTSQDPKLVVIHSTDPTVPTSLQTEGQTNPADITDITPEFSAIFSDPDSGDLALHYRLQVSSSSAFTNTDWDSAKTALSSSTPVGVRSPQISYAGSTLELGATYYWRIKFWDDSSVEGVWSTATSTFSLYAPKPDTLLTEGVTNPTSVWDETPEFSAIFRDSASTTAAYYRIQVATSSAFTTTFWDSTQTTLSTSTPEGSRTPDISYAGPDLTPGTLYYWRIKLWNSTGYEGLWSTETATFTTVLPGTSNILQDIRFTYDTVGNITRINDYSGTQLARVTLFEYDDLHRLTTASTTAASSTPFSQTYTYDALGNIVNKSDQGTYTYDETGYANPHAVTAIASTTLGYDANGNLTSYGTNLYAFDYRNRMASSTVSGLGATYGYDHSMQRVSKTMGGITTVYPNQYFEKEGTATTTKYIWAGGDLIATVNGNGVSTSTEYSHSDHLGSTNVTTDESGEVTSTLDYLPFGSERISTGDELPGRGYIGQFTDREQDLSYLQNRYYSSDRGQFISQDPVFWEVGLSQDGRMALLDPQQQNSYSYARNNPVTLSDPDGRFVPLVLGAAYLALSIYDAYDTASTIADPNASFGDKAIAGGLFLTPLGEVKAGAKGLSKVDNMLRNAVSGAVREARFGSDLAKQFPGSSIQREMYLRNADGSIARDPLTGEGRRIDFAVVNNGKVQGLHEVTSQTANKRDQLLKEDRIREAGGTFIKDRQTGKLVDVSKNKTSLNRRD